MKIFKGILMSIMLLAGSQIAMSQSLGDLLKGLGGSGSSGNIISNVIEGVFTKTDLSLSDLVGEYKSEGPAVTFKSDNFLQKAGGIAGAAAIESKLQPYYEKYGLSNMTLTIDQNANFEMKIKGIPLKGDITKNDDGTFEFNFKVAGIKLGKFTAYIEKSGSTLKLMFDANKLKSFISSVASITGNSMISTIGSLLDSYEGACIGFKMASIGSPMQSNSPSTQPSANNQTDSGNQSKTSTSSNSLLNNGLNALKGLFNTGK